MFPERLKALRKKAGLTQKELANIFNISQPALANWEKGTKKPTQEKLKPLADFFSVSTDYLLGKTDNLISSEDIQEAINNSVSYNGNKISVDDKKVITEFLENYFKEKYPNNR